jgi:hypothetical protein
MMQYSLSLYKNAGRDVWPTLLYKLLKILKFLQNFGVRVRVGEGVRF